MLILDKVVVGDLFTSKYGRGFLGVVEEPLVGSDSLSMITEKDMQVVMTYKQLEEEYNFIQKSTREGFEWRLYDYSR